MQKRVLVAFLYGVSLLMFAADLSAGRRKVSPPAPVITSPPAGSIITSPVTFTWTSGGTAKTRATQFFLQIGTSPNAGDLYTSPSLILANSVTVTLNLPTDGSTVYVTLCAVEWVGKPPRQEFICGNSVAYLTPAPTPTPTPTPVPQGSCQSSSSLAVLVDQVAKTVVAYVPHGNWGLNVTGVAAVNVEGSSITNTAIATADAINSCASNSVTGQTVCTANNNKVYILKGAALDPAVVTNPLASSGSGTISFSGGDCTNCGVAMDAVHNKAVIGLAFAPSVGGFQFLNLGSSPSFEPAFASKAPSGEISEDPLIDPSRNTLGLNSVTGNPAGSLLLSPNESNNYEILDITMSTSPSFFEQLMSGASGEAEAAGEDCQTGIILTTFEFTDPSQVFVADLNSSMFMPGMPGSWTGLSAINTLTGSTLSAGPCGLAVAQGTHTGIVTGEFGGNNITAIALPPTPGVVTLPGWITCAIPSDPSETPWSTGNDPHTVIAYMSPNDGHAYALVANGGDSAPTYLARIDLTMMLALAESSPGSHVCASTTLPAGVVTFIAVP
jgi:hypothetical protein